MSWLDDEANDDKNKKDSDLRKKELITRSNYWALILDALRSEAEAINVHPHWKATVGPFPVRFAPAFGSEEWQVTRSGIEFVMVAIQNKSDHVLVGRRFSNESLYKDFKKTEELRIETKESATVLVTENNETLIVPEDVVRYLLRAVIAVLKQEAA